MIARSATAASFILAVTLTGCSDPMMPPPFQFPPVLAEVALGQTHTCALKSGGKMSCWGFNMDGELGTGVPASNSWTPVVVPMDRPFASVAAGSSHTCGLDRSGIAFCWGSVAGGRSPVAAGGAVRFEQLTAGSGFTCGLDAAGEAHCWVAAGHTPTRVAAGMAFKQVAAGGGAKCAITTAGAAYCWGSGPLGHETVTSSAVPVAVSGGHVFKKVDVGNGHACGLAADGSAWCWGDATHGQMGDGRPPSTDIRAPGVWQPTPVRVASALPFTDIAAGDRFACGLTGAGTAWCWGYNSGGQLGDGSTVHRGSPVAVGSPSAFTSIHAGGYHTCAIGGDTTDPALYCWGDNMFGQLGVGAGAVHRTPVQVTLPETD